MQRFHSLFFKTRYMFQTGFPFIIRSSKLHIQRQAFVRPILLPAASLTVLARLAAGSCMCSFELWWWTEKPSETCRASYRNK